MNNNLIYKMFSLSYIKQNINVMEYPDEIVLGIVEYLSKQESQKGKISELIALGYELDLVESLMYAGLINILKADCEDPNGRYIVTDMGNEYFKIILQ